MRAATAGLAVLALSACEHGPHVVLPELACPHDSAQSRDWRDARPIGSAPGLFDLDWPELVAAAGGGVQRAPSGGEAAWWSATPLTVDWSDAEPIDVHHLGDCETPAVSAEVMIHVASEDVSFLAPGFVWIEDEAAPVVSAWWVGSLVVVPVDWADLVARASEGRAPDELSVLFGGAPEGSTAVPESGWAISGIWTNGDQILEERVLDRGLLTAP